MYNIYLCVCEQVCLSIFKTFTVVAVSETNFLLFKAQKAKQIVLLQYLFTLPKPFDFSDSTTYWLRLSTNTQICALKINLKLCFHFGSQVKCPRLASQKPKTKPPTALFCNHRFFTNSYNSQACTTYLM